jgi:hypothetical protein
LGGENYSFLLVVKTRKENGSFLFMVKCEEKDAKKEDGTIVNHGFPLPEKPGEICRTDGSVCLENSGTSTEAAFATMKQIRSLNVP